MWAAHRLCTYIQSCIFNYPTCLLGLLWILFVYLLFASCVVANVCYRGLCDRVFALALVLALALALLSPILSPSPSFLA